MFSLSLFFFFLLREGCWGHESSLFIFADNPINTTYFSVKDKSECVGRINGSSSCVCSPRCVSENIDTLNHAQSHRQARPHTHTNTIGTQRCRRPFLSISDNTYSADHDSESRLARWPSASSGIDFSHLAGYQFLTVHTLARRWTSAEMSRLPRCDWRTTNPVTYSVKPPWFLKSPLSASYPRFMHDAVTPTSCRRWHTEWHKHLLSVEHRMSCVGEDGSPPRRPSSKSPSDVTRLFCQCPSTSPHDLTSRVTSLIFTPCHEI